MHAGEVGETAVMPVTYVRVPVTPSETCEWCGGDKKNPSGQCGACGRFPTLTRSMLERDYKGDSSKIIERKVVYTRDEIEREWQKECQEAYKANFEAHDAFEGPTNVQLKRVPIVGRDYKELNKGDYDTRALYLALAYGRWSIGTISYYEPQKRYDFVGGSSVISQVEHLQQLYEIDLPEIPDRLIPEPEMLKELEEEED